MIFPRMIFHSRGCENSTYEWPEPLWIDGDDPARYPPARDYLFTDASALLTDGGATLTMT